MSKVLVDRELLSRAADVLGSQSFSAWDEIAEQLRAFIAEPAPAQDERVRLLARCLEVAAGFDSRLCKDIEAAIIAEARPAQAEQQPVAWVEVKDRHEGPYEFHGIELLDSGKHDLFIAPIANPTPQGKFRMGDMVKKTSGSEWQGRICGTYSTALTPEGYAVESEAHAGSVQIYPAKALELVPMDAKEA